MFAQKWPLNWAEPERALHASVFWYIDAIHVRDCQDTWTASTRAANCLLWRLSTKTG